MFRYQKEVSMILLFIISYSFFTIEVSYSMNMDEFYRDYLIQRIMIAQIRELKGDESASSLLRDLKKEAEKAGLQNTVWSNSRIKNLPNPGEYSIKNGKKPVWKYEGIIKKAAEIHQLPPELIKAVIKVESDFMYDAISCKGAQGLMQLMPETAKEINVPNPFNPRSNIFGGTKLLKKHLNEFGSLKKALIAYNAGPGWVKRKKWIPKETKRYIRRVIHYYHVYKKEL